MYTHTHTHKANTSVMQNKLLFHWWKYTKQAESTKLSGPLLISHPLQHDLLECETWRAIAGIEAGQTQMIVATALRKTPKRDL